MSMSVGWATIASKIVPGASLACFPLMKMSGTKTTTARVTDRRGQALSGLVVPAGEHEISAVNGRDLKGFKFNLALNAGDFCRLDMTYLHHHGRTGLGHCAAFNDYISPDVGANKTPGVRCASSSK